MTSASPDSLYKANNPGNSAGAPGKPASITPTGFSPACIGGHGCPISSNPVCMPARSTIATGLTTRGHGVLENGYQLDPGLPTFMRTLQQEGWRTGAFGKVHFRPHYAGVFPDYRPYGFDVTHITEDGRGGEWLDWVEREHPEQYEPGSAGAER